MSTVDNHTFTWCGIQAIKTQLLDRIVEEENDSCDNIATQKNKLPEVLDLVYSYNSEHPFELIKSYTVDLDVVKVQKDIFMTNLNQSKICYIGDICSIFVYDDMQFSVLSNVELARIFISRDILTGYFDAVSDINIVHTQTVLYNYLLSNQPYNKIDNDYSNIVDIEEVTKVIKDCLRAISVVTMVNLQGCDVGVVNLKALNKVLFVLKEISKIYNNIKSNKKLQYLLEEEIVISTIVDDTEVYPYIKIKIDDCLMPVISRLKFNLSSSLSLGQQLSYTDFYTSIERVLNLYDNKLSSGSLSINFNEIAKGVNVNRITNLVNKSKENTTIMQLLNIDKSRVFSNV